MNNTAEGDVVMGLPSLAPESGRYGNPRRDQLVQIQLNFDVIAEHLEHHASEVLIRRETTKLPLPLSEQAVKGTHGLRYGEGGGLVLGYHHVAVLILTRDKRRDISITHTRGGTRNRDEHLLDTAR